jgi:hypothetical protein
VCGFRINGKTIQWPWRSLIGATTDKAALRGPKSGPLALIDHDKDMSTACDSPIATLAVPIAVLVTAPIGRVPVATSVDSSCTVRMDGIASGPIGMIGTIGATNGRATSCVHRRAITGLNCRASTIMGYFSIFPLISISVKSGG